ncbi:MAG: hypothetical protein H6P98_2025, partial [Candidatus Aminicenantes bacterium]|nr:hypothetical protein [Candidatus Aminicenantes bacterium]
MRKTTVPVILFGFVFLFLGLGFLLSQ